jgi:hypothetical protein
MNAAEMLRELTRRLRGRRVLGGCDECNAYQTMEEAADPSVTVDGPAPFVAVPAGA